MIFLAQQMKLPKALNHKVVANLDAEIWSGETRLLFCTDFGGGSSFVQRFRGFWLAV